MKVFMIIACVLFAGVALAEDGYITELEHYTEEELAQGCEGVAELATMMYTVRNMLPADLEQEKAMEITQRMVSSGRLAEAADRAPEEERQQVREMLSDADFQEAFLMAAEYAWAHPHQDEYEMTEEERAQDLVEFHEDVVWNCENLIAGEL